VAALNRDPGELVREGRLREDLYHRLNVGRVELPPLRERTGDVPILARHFLQQFGRGEVEGIEPEAMKLLEAYSWPGNVRELRNLMRRIVALTPRPVVTRADLPETLRTRAVADTDASFTAARDRHLAAFEKEYLTAMLRQTHGDVSAAAQAAEISRATFYRLLKKHRMDPDRFRSEADAQGG